MLGNLHQKYNDIDNLLVDAIENYHEPKRFFTYSGAAIQACRNFTFALQANKHQISNFNKWYGQWQENMRNDPYMKWIHDKRNEVVKQDVLGSESYALLFTISDYRNASIEERYDYMTSGAELAAKAQQHLIKRPELAYSTIAVERAYKVDFAGKTEELMRILYYAFYYLGLLFGDLEVYLKTRKVDSIPNDLPEIIKSELSKDEWYRFHTFKIKDGQPLNKYVLTINRDEAAIEQTKQRYGGSGPKITARTPIDKAARTFFNLAKTMLATDGKYLSTVSLKTQNGYHPIPVVFHDRAEKLNFAFDLPVLIKEYQATGIMFISEVWKMDNKRLTKRLKEGKRVEGARKKSEGLWLTMLTDELDTLDIYCDVHKSGDEITFGKTIITKPEVQSLNFLRPVYLLWRPKSPK